MLYIVCEGVDGTDLGKVVQRFLDDGWKPQGGVSSSTSLYIDPDGEYYSVEHLYQAMTKD